MDKQMAITKQEIIHIMLKDLHNDLTDYQQILIELKILKKAHSNSEMKELIVKYQDRFFDFQQYCEEKKWQENMKLEKEVAEYVEYLIKGDASEDILADFLHDSSELDREQLLEKYPAFNEYLS